MALDRNAPAFAHHNQSTRIIPLEGAHAGRALTINSAESIKMDPGNKVSHLKGGGAGPLAVVSGGAEPSFEFKLSTSDESVQILKHLGHIHIRFTIVTTFTRMGKKRVTYRAKNCLAEKGLGLETDHDKGTSDTVSGKCTDITVQEAGGKELSVAHAEA